MLECVIEPRHENHCLSTDGGYMSFKCCCACLSQLLLWNGTGYAVMTVMGIKKESITEAIILVYGGLSLVLLSD